MQITLDQLDGLAEMKLNHPTRLRIALHLAEQGPASPNEVTKAADGKLSLGAVAYHVRTLSKDGLIELHDERRVRGAVEHIYRLKPATKRRLGNVLPAAA